MEVTKKKTIWIVNKHAAPIKYNATNMRTFKMAYYFRQMGYDVYVVSSGFVHNRNIELIDGNKEYEIKEYDGVKFIHIRSPHYTTNGLKRMYSIFGFSRLLYKLRNKLPKPDTIIHTSSIPFDFLVYSCAKKLQAKYIIEVVDLWPESFVAFGLASKRNPVLQLMYRVEKYLYTKCDNLVFSMEGGKDYIKEKGWDKVSGGSIDLDKVHYLNNGVDTEDFDSNLLEFRLEDEHLEDSTIKRVIYLGSIRRANNLIKFIETAKYFKDNTSIKYLIYGDGDDREELIEYCKKNDLTNVIFKQKWIEPQYVPYVLNSGYINIINYMPNSIERYGGSQNKMFQALASGRPLCSNLGMGYSIINKYNVGIDKSFKDDKEYYLAIKSILDMPNDQYEDICKRARETALEFDLKKLADTYIERFNL